MGPCSSRQRVSLGAHLGSTLTAIRPLAAVIPAVVLLAASALVVPTSALAAYPASGGRTSAGVAPHRQGPGQWHRGQAAAPRAHTHRVERRVVREAPRPHRPAPRARPRRGNDLFRFAVAGAFDVQIEIPDIDIRLDIPDIYIGTVGPGARKPRPRTRVTAPEPPPAHNGSSGSDPNRYEIVEEVVDEDPTELAPAPPYPTAAPGSTGHLDAPGEVELIEEHCIELPHGSEPLRDPHRAIMNPDDRVPTEIIDVPMRPTQGSALGALTPAPAMPTHGPADQPYRMDFVDAGEAGSAAVDGDYEQVEWAILDRINAVRAEHGLGALAFDGRLQAASIGHSEEMYRMNYFGHRSPVAGHAEFTQRIAAAGVGDFGVAGENLAMGPDARDVADRFVQMWMDSPAHRANVLQASYRFTGIGVYGDQERVYATQLFSAEVQAH